jgi:CheY-like chemotaxis protein
VNILVVEDDKDNADTLSALLRMHGHRVDVYSTAEDVIDRLGDDDPAADAAVIDLRLPGSDGTTVLRVMRTLAKWKYVPVVLTSGAVDELPGDSLFGGPSVCLAKPFDIECLMDALDQASKIKVRR